MIEVKCVICGVVFESERSSKKFCSQNCHSINRYGKPMVSLEKRNCLSCGSSITPRKESHLFCNKKCSKDFERKGVSTLNCLFCGDAFQSIRSNATSCGKRDLIHRPNEKERFIEASCSFCGVRFNKTVSAFNRTEREGSKHFCSLSCSAESHLAILNCSTCGKEFKRKKSQADRNYIFCSRLCQSKNIDYILRGSDHYCFIDGAFSQRRGKGWKTIRKKIRERDNFTCQHCGIKEDELSKALDVHHKIPFRDFDDSEEANKPDNLISLCPSCHHKEENLIFKMKG